MSKNKTIIIDGVMSEHGSEGARMERSIGGKPMKKQMTMKQQSNVNSNRHKVKVNKRLKTDHQ
jgi:hypothetical protein